MIFGINTIILFIIKNSGKLKGPTGVSQSGPAVRLVSKMTSVRFISAIFFSSKVVICGRCHVFCLLQLINETFFKMVFIAAIFMQNHSDGDRVVSPSSPTA